MIAAALIFFVVYTVLLGVIISFGFSRQREKERTYQTTSETIALSELVVLIPFRNEENRIKPLLRAICSLEEFPKEFVFIDDHSDDNTVALISKELKGVSYKILTLPEGIFGKKRALRFATQNSESAFILTMDADVEFGKDYFSRLRLLDVADLYILPAIMLPQKFPERFYELDLILVNAANAGLAGLSRPIIASGANLLYRRRAFNEVDKPESHLHMASGDDTYLLRDFRENKRDVRLHSSPTLAVYTKTPESFREFIDQRLRWIGKTRDIKDGLSTFLGVTQTGLTIGFLALLLISGISMEFKSFFAFLGLKSLIDLFLFYNYFARIGRLSAWVLIPLYELLFPLYTLLIMLLLITYQPKWKGRAIYQDKI